MSQDASFLKKIQRPQEQTTLGDEQMKKKKAVLQDFLFRDAWVIGLYLWPHFSFRFVAVLQRFYPLVQSLHSEGEGMVSAGYRALYEVHGSVTCMLSYFHTALSLNRILNASLQQRDKRRHRKRQSAPSLSGTSFWIAPKPELLGRAKSQGGLGLLLAVLVNVLQRRQRSSAVRLQTLARETGGTFVDLPLDRVRFIGRTTLYMVCTANKPCLLCALLELLRCRYFCYTKTSRSELWHHIVYMSC